MSSMLQDPEMEEVIVDFQKESEGLFNECEELLEDFEDDNSQMGKLEKFGQVIDRVMGAAKSLELNIMGTYCELGKTISYKASQSMDIALLEIVAAVLFDTMEILQSMNKNLVKYKEEKVEGINLEKFATRLHWLADKFSNIERASVAIDAGGETKLTDQSDIDKLLADLGL
jgi:chemotaxis protein histidine kinase CheA